MEMGSSSEGEAAERRLTLFFARWRKERLTNFLTRFSNTKRTSNRESLENATGFEKLEQPSTMRIPQPRPEKDFRVDSVAWSLDSVQRHTAAGFPEIPHEVVVRRFWQYLRFLQSHGLTVRTIVRSQAEVGDATELNNSDLTDEGFRFIQYSHQRWVQRLYKDKGEQKEDGYLEKWYEKFRSEVT
jgi:hypothetical protein